MTLTNKQITSIKKINELKIIRAESVQQARQMIIEKHRISYGYFTQFKVNCLNRPTKNRLGVYVYVLRD